MDFIALLLGLLIGLVAALGVAFYFWRIKAKFYEQEITSIRNQGQTHAVEAATLRERAKVADTLESQIVERDRIMEAMRADLGTAKEKLAQLESSIVEREKAFSEQKATLINAEEKLKEAFKNLATDAVRMSHQDFLELARKQFEGIQKDSQAELDKRKVEVEHLLKPVQEGLKKLDEVQQTIEEKRIGAYSELMKQLDMMSSEHIRLQKETRNLVAALKSPTRRGQWGELQLRRVVEMAGMLERCDFDTQVTVRSDGGALRPDVIVHLPNDRTVVVDAKAALDAYMRAIESDDDETRKLHFIDHARQVRDHVLKLGEKKYWSQFPESPEFVVMFLPGEPIFSAALEHDSSLIEYGLENKVLIATPTTLIALLRTVASGWRQERLAADAENIRIQAEEIYTRIGTFANHLVKVGSNLDTAVKSYNEGIGSLQRNVLPSLRRIKKLAAIPTKEVAEPVSIDLQTRELTIPEMEHAVVDAGELGALELEFVDEG